MAFVFRDYQPGDYPALMELWQATELSRPERGDDNQVIQRTLQLGGKLILLWDTATQQLAGSSWLTTDGRRLHLHHFGIAPPYQGQGLAKQLLARSFAFVRQQGMQVKLEVHQANHKAIGLYQQAGFEFLGDYDVYIIRTPSITKHYVP